MVEKIFDTITTGNVLNLETRQRSHFPIAMKNILISINIIINYNYLKTKPGLIFRFLFITTVAHFP